MDRLEIAQDLVVIVGTDGRLKTPDHAQCSAVVNGRIELVVDPGAGAGDLMEVQLPEDFMLFHVQVVLAQHFRRSRECSLWSS